jgi:hypothetical protein
MPSFNEYVEKANSALAQGIRDARTINVQTVEVLRATTSLLVPLSVAMIPRGERLMPRIDEAVNRGFDSVVNAVKSQYRLAQSVIDRLRVAA